MKRGRVPDAPLRMVIRNRLESYTVSRPTLSKDAIGQSDSSYSTHEERLWVYNPSTTTTQVDFGEQQEGDLSALGLPDADVQEDDRIDYGGHTYEVDSPPTSIGNESYDDYVTLSLTRVRE